MPTWRPHHNRTSTQNGNPTCKSKASLCKIEFATINAATHHDPQSSALTLAANNRRAASHKRHIKHHKAHNKKLNHPRSRYTQCVSASPSLRIHPKHTHIQKRESQSLITHAAAAASAGSQRPPQHSAAAPPRTSAIPAAASEGPPRQQSVAG